MIFNVNYAQSSWDHVPHCRDTPKKFTVGIQQLLVVHVVRSSFRIEAILKFTCSHIPVYVPLSKFLTTESNNSLLTFAFKFITIRCAEQECTAAFTTKQCLQFHYKKVHGYAQEQMPKIERSVAYTFDAYSGGLQPEPLGKMLSIT